MTEQVRAANMRERRLADVAIMSVKKTNDVEHTGEQ